MIMGVTSSDKSYSSIPVPIVKLVHTRPSRQRANVPAPPREATHLADTVKRLEAAYEDLEVDKVLNAHARTTKISLTTQSIPKDNQHWSPLDSASRFVAKDVPSMNKINETILIASL